LKDPPFLAGKIPLFPFHGLESPVQVLFLVHQPSFHLANFFPLFAGLPLELRFKVDEFFFRLQDGLLGNFFSFCLRLVQDVLGLFPGLGQGSGVLPFFHQIDGDSDAPQNQGGNANNKSCIHFDHLL